MEHFRSFETLSKRDIYETAYEEQLITEVRDFITTLNEESLKSIFERELRLSGAENARTLLIRKFVPFEKVIIDGTKDDTSLGSFNRKRGIEIYPKAIVRSVGIEVLLAQSDTIKEISEFHRQFESIDNEPSPEKDWFSIIDPFEKLKRLRLVNAEIKKLRDSRIMDDELMEALFLKLETIHTLVHEELHAISSNEEWDVTRYGSVDEGTVSLSTHRSGFNETSLLMRYNPWEVKPSVDEKQRRFVGLNEGITELNALRLSREYVLSELPDQILGIDANAFYDLVEIKSYNRERWVAEQLVLLLATIAEVPTEMVERALFKAYLNATDVLPEELIESLKVDLPTLSETEIERLLLKLQIAISSRSFGEDDTDISRIFVEFADLLPLQKRDTIKDGLKALFYTYSFSKELKDGIVSEE